MQFSFRKFTCFLRFYLKFLEIQMHSVGSNNIKWFEICYINIPTLWHKEKQSSFKTTTSFNGLLHFCSFLGNTDASGWIQQYKMVWNMLYYYPNFLAQKKSKSSFKTTISFNGLLHFCSFQLQRCYCCWVGVLPGAYVATMGILDMSKININFSQCVVRGENFIL